ncbi:hypothetical protein ASJ80_10965 [Methanobacterium bryantii]|jgi:hypothetical protein|uniref:SbsA Ig-like domain-containing protein n=2 Tax=Methanobacterium bryantii TaxID=2161 RepID=A0A2A2H6D5_METBR|nr:hypothetical protein ASJ80_10965 [Methanobacterium bryantii]
MGVENIKTHISMGCANKTLCIVFLFSIAFIILSAVNAVSADSSIIYVDSGGNDNWNGEASVWNGTDGPKKSIKNATGTVIEGGTVKIADGSYTGEGNTNIYIEKNMTIRGQSKENTVINGAGEHDGIFQIQDGITVIIMNLTMTKGTSEMEGGGAVSNDGTLTIINCIFTDNKGGDGGAIFNYGNLTVNNCTFTGNEGFGGAIYNGNKLNVINSTFTGNIATERMGGAIYNSGTLIVTGSIFTNNTADYGGAISNEGTVTVTNSTFKYNVVNSTYDDVVSYGGAIYNKYGNFNVNGCTFTGNKASGTNTGPRYRGGAISNGGTLNVKNSTFTNNAADYGGAIANWGKSSVSDSIFIGNNASTVDEKLAYYGGAIYNKGTLTVTGSNFTGNLGDYGGAISNLYGSNTTVSGSTFKNNGGNLYGDAVYNRGKLIMHFCSFIGNHIEGCPPEDIYNDDGSADVRYNWWGSNTSPSERVYYDATFSPWLVLTVTASPGSVKAGGVSTITADLCHDSKGTYHDPAGGYVPDGIKMNLSATLGTLGGKSLSTINGTAKTTFKGGSTGGIAKILVKADSQTAYKYVTVDIAPPKIASTSPKNKAAGVSRTGTIKIKFSENIKTGVDWSKIYVKNKYGKKVAISKSISGNYLYIKTTSKRYSYSYYAVYIPVSAVKDYVGNNLTKYYTFKFKTGKY